MLSGENVSPAGYLRSMACWNELPILTELFCHADGLIAVSGVSSTGIRDVASVRIALRSETSKDDWSDFC